MARYAINMDTGVVVGMTSETLGNYVYQEIRPRVALAIAQGKVSAQYVISEIEKKLPKQKFAEKLQLVAKQNVRRQDFGLKEAARKTVDIGPSRVVDIDLPGETGEADKAAALAAAALDTSEQEAETKTKAARKPSKKTTKAVDESNKESTELVVEPVEEHEGSDDDIVNL